MWDAIIVGGGAAGLFCASTAARRGRSILLLEGNDRVGLKILISGGGRCNFTNLNAHPKNYHSQSPNFCKSALSRFTPNDFMQWIHKHNISFHHKTPGQLFCDHSSKQIVQMLLSECAETGVQVLCNQRVRSVERNECYKVITDHETYLTRSLVIATGGLSFPKLGANAFGYRIAEQFNVPIIPDSPALAPLMLEGKELTFAQELAGISLPVIISCDKKSYQDDLLLTHRGISGPAALQISSHWQSGFPIRINLVPSLNITEWLIQYSDRKQRVDTILSKSMPQRLAKAIASRFEVHQPLAQTPAKKLRELGCFINNWTLTPTKTEGYEKAEVTRGGVDTRAISSQTMEARNVPGLYFIGEVVDVTGDLGGYNFQWAWASAHAAAQSV